MERAAKLPPAQLHNARRDPSRRCAWTFQDRFAKDDPVQSIISSKRKEGKKDLEILKVLQAYHRDRIVPFNPPQEEPVVAEEPEKATVVISKPGAKEETAVAEPKVHLRNTQMRVVWKKEGGTYAEREQERQEYIVRAEKRQQDHDNELFAMIAKAKKRMGA